MAEKHPLVILPSDAPSSVAAQKMTEAFDESGSDNLLVVAFINENGLERADEDTYRKVVDAVRDDVTDVVSVQDFVSTPQLRQVPDERGQDDLGAAGQPRGRVGHAACL